MRASAFALVALVLGVAPTSAQDPSPCRVLCAPEFKVEPTITFTTLFNSPRILLDDGVATRDERETDFELILSVGLPTRISWLDFTVEAIFLPFEADSTPELEFETNFVWLPARRTRGWLSSHFDVVDKFSPAERPTDRRAYTHKLNFELDTSPRDLKGRDGHNEHERERPGARIVQIPTAFDRVPRTPSLK